MKTAWAACALVFAGAAWAGDRPFAAVTSAAAESDDFRVWAIEATLQSGRTQRGLRLAAEYAFEPQLSVQIEAGRTRARHGGGDAGREVEAELKWLANDIARDGWGAGIVLALGAAAPSGGGWRGGAYGIVAPLSWRLGADGALLHLNAGLVRESGERRQRLLALGVEAPIARRVTALAELARTGDARLGSAGLRWWVQREKWALDLATWRSHDGEGGRSRGWTFGIGRYDL